MSKRILIDASNAEETRVAVTENEKLDDFEIETSKKSAVKGDVFLAKITRVEPSLQAAFVDFGKNRNGFLPLTEIHPDYFKIPVVDQEKLSELLKELKSSENDSDKLDSGQEEVISDEEEVNNNEIKEEKIEESKNVKIKLKLEIIKKTMLIFSESIRFKM